MPHRADLQPAVGGRQEQVGGVVGVRQLQHSLLEASFMPETFRTNHPFMVKTSNKTNLQTQTSSFGRFTNIQSIRRKSNGDENPVALRRDRPRAPVSYLKARMVVRPSAVSEKWQSRGSWVESSRS